MIRLALTGQKDDAQAYAAAAARVGNLELVSVDRDAFDAIALVSDFKGATELMTRAAAAGKHVLIDIGLTATIAAVADACRQTGARLMLAGSLRHAPSNRAVKESLTTGKLGLPGLLRMHRWRAGGDAKLLARELDLAHWLFGAVPTEIYAARTAGYVQGHFGFPEGGMALIDSCSKLPAGDDYFSLCLIGSTGAAYADEHRDVQLLYCGGHPSALKTGQGDMQLVAELQEFAAAIEQHREPSITAADARAAIQVAAAVETSISSGRALRLTEGHYDFA